MSNSRFSILQARAISDKRISDAQFRTLAALGMYADRDGWCFPSLTRIGADCNKSKQAAGRDIIHLRKCGYVESYPQFNSDGSRKPNKYRLKFDPPVNVGDSTPSASEVDTPSASEVDVNVPINVPNNNKPDLVDHEIQMAKKIAAMKGATDAFESALGFGSLNWDTKTEWTRFKKFVIAEYEKDNLVWKKYADWRKSGGKYDSMSNKQIRMNPVMFIDTGYPTFCASVSMYGIEGEGKSQHGAARKSEKLVRNYE